MQCIMSWSIYIYDQSKSSVTVGKKTTTVHVQKHNSSSISVPRSNNQGHIIEGLSVRLFICQFFCLSSLSSLCLWLLICAS